jgi:hypothetical protein
MRLIRLSMLYSGLKNSWLTVCVRRDVCTLAPQKLPNQPEVQDISSLLWAARRPTGDTEAQPPCFRSAPATACPTATPFRSPPQESCRILSFLPPWPPAATPPPFRFCSERAVGVTDPARDERVIFELLDLKGEVEAPLYGSCAKSPLSKMPGITW